MAESNVVTVTSISKETKDGIPATVKAIEYDPNRSANIALLFYADGEKRYILAPNKLEIGTDTLMSGEKAEPKVGNAMKIERYSSRVRYS